MSHGYYSDELWCKSGMHPQNPVVIYDGQWMLLSTAKAFFAEAAKEQIAKAEADIERDRKLKLAWEQRHEQWKAERKAAIPGQIKALMERIKRRERFSEAGVDQFAEALTDHDFIEWKFLVASRPSRRWLAPL